RFYRLNSGEIMSLENEEFSSIQQMLDDLDVDRQDIHDGSVKMLVYRGMQIDELIETRKKYDPSFEKLLNHLKSPEEQHYDLPKNLNATLRSYQETGFQWYKSLSDYHLGGILADDMGLGKTLQSIAYILSEPSDLPHLVVVPSSVVYNWKNEFEKFAPDLSVAIMRGTPPERSQKIKDSGEIDVWTTSYATLRQDIDQYAELKFQTMILDEANFIKKYAKSTSKDIRKKIKYSGDIDVWNISYATIRQDIDQYAELKFQTMILDEAQFIKNYATKTSKAIRQIQASRRFALSGTPIENSIDEL